MMRSKSQSKRRYSPVTDGRTPGLLHAAALRYGSGCVLSANTGRPNARFKADSGSDRVIERK